MTLLNLQMSLAQEKEREQWTERLNHVTATHCQMTELWDADIARLSKLSNRLEKENAELLRKTHTDASSQHASSVQLEAVAALVGSALDDGYEAHDKLAPHPMTCWPS